MKSVKVKKKSLIVNGGLNAMKSLSAIIFPLISFKYVSNILLVENIGKYNFASSIVAYFSFIAALGITTYAIRSGAPIRNEKNKISVLVSEVFSIGIIATLIAYILLLALLLFSKTLKPYVVLICILSIQILFKTISVEWIFFIYEDYFFVTVRSIAFQCFSLILLLIFVKSPNDLYKYALISVFSYVGSGIIDFIFAMKYCAFRFTLSMNLKKHILPIIYIFAQNISVLVYVNSDMTILGLLDSDYSTGIYSVSSNVYKGMKAILSAVIAVSIPRLSYHIGRQDIDAFNKVLSTVYKTVITFSVPLIIGVTFMSKDIICLLSGQSYIEADSSLKLLSIATIFCMLSYIFGQGVMIPLHKEKLLMIITMISAIINIALNFLFIPLFHQNAAAFTTIIAEALVFASSLLISRKDIYIMHPLNVLCKSAVGGLCVAIICTLSKNTFGGYHIRLLISVVISAIVYFFVEVLLKNDVFTEFLTNQLWRKNGRKKEKND